MNRKYDDEFKRQAVKKVFDGQSVASISRGLVVNEGLIHKWKRVTSDNGDGHRTDAQLSEAAALKKRIREFEMENAHLKKGGADLQARKLIRYKFIEAEKSLYPIKRLCHVIKVNRSHYYAYAKIRMLVSQIFPIKSW